MFPKKLLIPYNRSNDREDSQIALRVYLHTLAIDTYALTERVAYQISRRNAMEATIVAHVGSENRRKNAFTSKGELGRLKGK